ncbi:MAG: Na/Pi symporter [Lachnospiraceae bacterium]|nr:Na/Pi symporter [Lachnospiraceae bacterium]
MDLSSLPNLIGGIGLFLFGMSLMGSSLEKLAGGKLEKILEALTTSNKKGVGEIKGWALGLGVTGIIQSSSATTLMLIGFVNAGIMKLSQAIPVVFGANVGSTVTAQILRLGDIGSGSIILNMLKPSSFAPILIGIGALIMLLTKKAKRQKAKDVAGIMIGLGLLFTGMNMMEGVFAPLKDSPKFKELFVSFSNPLIGILAGVILTAIIQSSSAAVGILQALSATGSVTYAIAIPFIIGQNIGKCMPIVLGAIGASKKAKRVSLTYILFNVIGAVFFTVLIYGIAYTVGLPILEKTMNRGNIANVHTSINLINSILLLPFCGQVAKLSAKLTHDNDNPVEDNELKKLDERLLKTPGIALKQCINIINMMGEKILENYTIVTGLIKEYDRAAFATLESNEAFIDKCETKLSSYVIKIESKRLTNDNRLVVEEILHSIGDFERIGDYCMNIAYAAQGIYENEITFSEKGMAEINDISRATEYILTNLVEAFANDKRSRALRITPLTDIVSELKDIIKANHVDRMQRGICSVEGGVALYDIINSFDRIADHAANIALHIIKRTGKDAGFDDLHGKPVEIFEEEYKALENYYYTMYIEPVRTGIFPEIEESDKGEGETSNIISDDSKPKKEKQKKKDIEDKAKAKADKRKSEKNGSAKDKSEKGKSEKESPEKRKEDKKKSDRSNSDKTEKKTDDKKNKKKKDNKQQ